MCNSAPVPVRTRGAPGVSSGAPHGGLLLAARELAWTLQNPKAVPWEVRTPGPGPYTPSRLKGESRFSAGLRDLRSLPWAMRMCCHPFQAWLWLCPAGGAWRGLSGVSPYLLDMPPRLPGVGLLSPESRGERRGKPLCPSASSAKRAGRLRPAPRGSFTPVAATKLDGPVLTSGARGARLDVHSQGRRGANPESLVCTFPHLREQNRAAGLRACTHRLCRPREREQSGSPPPRGTGALSATCPGCLRGDVSCVVGTAERRRASAGVVRGGDGGTSKPRARRRAPTRTRQGRGREARR